MITTITTYRSAEKGMGTVERPAKEYRIGVTNPTQEKPVYTPLISGLPRNNLKFSVIIKRNYA